MTAADIVRGVSAGVSPGSVTFNTVTVTLPPGAAAGDQLALFIDTRDTYAAWTPPAGWTQRFRPVESTGEGIFYTAKLGTDVTGTSWTFNTGATAASGKWGFVLIALKGSAVGDYLTGTASPQAASGTDAPSGSLTTAAPAHLVAFAGDRISGGSTWTWPAGWTEQADQQDSTGTNAISSSGAVYNTTPTPAGTYSVTPVHSTTGGNAWTGILAFAAVTTPPPATAKLHLGSADVTGLYVGSTAVSAAHLGSVQVYP